MSCHVKKIYSIRSFGYKCEHFQGCSQGGGGGGSGLSVTRPHPPLRDNYLLSKQHSNLLIQVVKKRESEESTCHKSFLVLGSYSVHTCTCTPFSGQNICSGLCKYPGCDPSPPPPFGKSWLCP